MVAAVPDESTSRYRWYVLAVLTLTYACAYVDRNVVLALVEPIKQEFLLSDMQVGLITGIAFSVCFVLAGIPMGVLIDRMNRRNLLACQLTAWSALTATGGVAGGFYSLLLTRMGVGAAEAGSTPNMMSIISDYFPLKQRATAIGLFNLSLTIGMVIGFAVGGWVAIEYGWRMALFVAGGLGAIFVALLLLTIREPVRGASDGLVAKAAMPSLADTVRFIRTQPSLLYLIAGLLLVGLVLQGFLGFLGSFLIRLHDMNVKESGFTIALYMGLVGGIGTPLGGWVADRLGRSDMRWLTRLPAITFFLSGIAVAGVLFAPTQSMALLALATMALFSHMQFGPVYGLCVSLVPPAMRGRTMAIIYVSANLGTGLGMLLIGGLSDAFKPAFGDEAIRYALLAVVPLMMCAAFCYFRAGRTLQPDLGRVAAGA
jgi:predicted MFS family arabinose efflux permease